MDWLNQDVLWNLFWKLVNFIVLAELIVYLVRKYDVFEKVFGGYRHKIQAEIDTAERLQQEAVQIKSDIERATKEAKTLSLELLEKAKAQAEREKDDLLDAAAAEAERIRKQARQKADYEQDRQLTNLQRDVIEQALEKAREKALADITKKVNDRLVDEFLKDLTEESVRLS